MNLFSFDKKSNFLQIVVSTVGILSLFFPWIYYPRLDLNIYGHNGDGWLFSMLFSIMLFLSLISLWKKSENYRHVYNMLIFAGSMLILALCIYKVYAFHEAIYNYQNDNPIMNYSGAGARLQWGLYAIAAISFANAFLSSLGMLFSTSKLRWYILSGLLLVGLISLMVYNTNKHKNKLDKVTVEENLNTYFNKMGETLIRKRSDQFVDFVHPILYQSIGGKEKLTQIMSALYADLSITEAKIDKILKTNIQDEAIQALLIQNFTIRKDGQQTETTSKSFAFSYDGGRTWSFAGTENRSFDEMKKILPELSEELRY
ncbi:MAG: hypothetical protein AAGA77_19110 [Bacteroidota bacterium]